MIPLILFNRTRTRRRVLCAAALWTVGTLSLASGTPPGVAAAGAPAASETASCLPSGDGYLRAHVAGAIDADIDWPNSGTQCQGEPRSKPPGVRLSFRRAPGGSRDLLFVFGLTGIREGQPARAAGANLTIILQGTDRIFGTLGDSRCTVDSLTQRRLKVAGSYRVEARGFCTQPAHAVRGDGAVLVSTFDFAGLVNYAADAASGASAAAAPAAPTPAPAGVAPAPAARPDPHR
jgi:hypothetical protein